MYKIEIPATIHQMFATFYRLGMWTKDDKHSLWERGRKLFYYFYYVIFNISMALGAYQTVDKDERIFFTVSTICSSVLIHKMWFILWKQNTISELIHEIGTYSTADQKEFIRVNNKLKKIMNFVRCFVLLVSVSFVFAVILFPLANEKTLFFKIAFPLNYCNSDIAFWMAFAFTVAGLLETVVCCLFAPILWYLVSSFVLKYEMLGNQFRTMGMVRAEETESVTQQKPATTKQQTLYAEDLIAAIQTFDEINGKLDEFASFFSNLFFLQMATSSFCICGTVYSLAFSSHNDLIQDLLYCLLLIYSFFDIFMVMFLGNEVLLSSDKLLYCLFESNWTEQTQSCKKSIFILAERLKQPHEIVVGKIYPLNLESFMSIVNGAYRMFNILKNFRK